MPILVVDDYNTMIRIIRNLLKQLGFENVDDASDGSAALAKMQVKKYGLVISDWNMEPMTGYDLLREVRASPELSKTPFIMITAESKTENVIAAKEGRRQQLHRQAVQCRDAEDQDGSGVRARRVDRRPPRQVSPELSQPRAPAPPLLRLPALQILKRTKAFSSEVGSRAENASEQEYLYGNENLREGRASFPKAAEAVFAGDIRARRVK